ncbi:MAG: DUF1993 domain-containing protein [Sphingomonadales bacterium]|nr:DUF1993 domain-containing protein [Sphingomonadales bacterium]
MLTLHQAVVPVFLQMLASAGRLLDKAERHCQDAGIAADELLSARLAPDMWDCAAQFQAACVQSAGALAGALAGSFTPAYPPMEHEFAALRTLVGATIAELKAAPPDAVEALCGREVVLRFSGHTLRFEASGFLTGFALPNVLFHVGTAYGILRQRGVPLGKADYLGRIPLLAD